MSSTYGFNDNSGDDLKRVGSELWAEFEVPAQRKKLSRNERLLVCLAIYDVEVRNGGHLQYFVNTAGDTYAEFMKHLERVLARDAVKRLKLAAQTIFGRKAVPKSVGGRRDAIPIKLSLSKKEKLNFLDASFYGGGDEELYRAIWIAVTKDRRILGRIDDEFEDEFEDNDE